jgi:hypothetical protein
MTRFDYVKYDQVAQDTQNLLKNMFQGIETVLSGLGNNRATSLAATKLEEAYMWVGKAIRDDQIKRNGSADLQEQRGKNENYR